MNIGAESGAAVESIFSPLFEEWDSELLPDPTLHTYLHSGFGLPLSYLFMREALNADALYHKERAELQAALSSPQAIDWSDLESFLAEQE